MVPTSSGFADPASTGNGNGNGEQDFYLHLHLPPELDLPMPATTQIYHQPPSSYLIPRWDLGPGNGAFTRLEFPVVGSRPNVQEDVDTFETILAQCTAFLERAPAPGPPPEKRRPSNAARAKAREAGRDDPPPYNPASFDEGEGYVQGSHSSHLPGRIVLIDEEDGSVMGELSDGFNVVEDSAVQPGSKGKANIVPFIVHVLTHLIIRTRRDYSPYRWQPQHLCSARLRLHRRYYAPCLQKIVHYLISHQGLAAAHHNI